MVPEIFVNIGSGNGLLPGGIEPLPEPMLNQRGPMTITWGQFHERYPSHQSLKSWELTTYDFIQISKGQLDMSMARRRLKSPQSLSGTSAHPTMVRLVNIMVMNVGLTSFSFHVNRPSQSWDEAISDSDLEISTPRSRSWVWSKGNVIQSAH